MITSFAKKLLNSHACASIERIIFWSAVLLHIIVFFTIATDNNGDPNEYIAIARSLFSADAPINPNRFVGYPFFLKITSLNLALLNLTFFAQHVLFLFSLWFFANKVTDIPIFRALLYLPALIPSIAYIPNLLFPDCVILSLLLILAAYLFAGQFIQALLIAIGLILIKLVFIFLPVVIFGVYALKKCQGQNKKWIILALEIALIGLIPSVFIFSPFPLYQSVVQKPAFIDEPKMPTAAPNPFQFFCGGEMRLLSDKTAIATFTDHSSDLYHMPLGQTLVKEFKCTPAEVKVIQRNLVISFMAQAPTHQLYKFIRRFTLNTFVFMDVPHVGYMLELKYQLMNSNFSPTQYYEKTQLEYFEGQGMKPVRPPGQNFLRILNAINFKYERILSVVITVLVGFISLGILFKRLRYLPTVTPILLLVIFYNFSITFFAFGYDRYIFINYFLWFAIIIVYLEYWVKNTLKISKGAIFH
jgi:hypothetical protein